MNKWLQRFTYPPINNSNLMTYFFKTTQRKIMRTLLLFIAILCCSVTTKAQSGKQAFLTKTLSGLAINSAKVMASGGSISVTGVDESQARLEVFVTSNNNGELSRDELQQRLDKYYTLDISTNNNQLIASVKQKNMNNVDWKKSVNVSFKIYLPINVTTDLETSGGSISLSNLNGTHTFKTSGGSIYVDNVKGKMKGKGSGGSITIQNSSNNIDLVTSGGSIRAKECTGNITLRTSGGSVDLDGLDGTIDAETSGGSIDADNIKGDLTASTSGGSIKLSNIYSSVNAETSGGGIEAAINETTKSVKLRNSGGSIGLKLPANKGFDLDLAADKINIDLKNFNGSVDERNIEGKLNGGGTLIDVHANSGRINVSFN
jgi:hypothetical protein